jgi:nucleoside-diphosphate-sugar epimerase
MKILITGGNGFVGRNIIDEIANNTDWELICLINKNRDNIPDNIKIFTDLDDVDVEIDVIIHAGGNPSSKSCIENPENGINDNILTTFKLLEYARKNNIKKFLLFSSCEVYGFASDTSSENDLLKSYNMYGASKVACEHMCSAYFHSYGICTTAIRLLNTYGPYCQKERFPSIIKSKFESEKNPHFILSDKTKKRWLNIKEMARRVVFIINNMPNSFEVFNFVGDENLTLIEFIEKISGSREFTHEYIKEEMSGYHHEGNADGSKFKNFCDNLSKNLKPVQKNILIYTHMPQFDIKDGGTVAQYNLAKLLEKFGQTVRIYSQTGILIQNDIFNKYYANDFPIDDNCVVIYCEGTQGNPLNAKNVVRWMLSELGKNVPTEWVHTWGKNELVYYFNSETRFELAKEKIGNVYKFLSCIYVNPRIENYNFSNRSGVCYTIRKSYWHTNGINIIHFSDSFEITREHTQDQCINILNKHQYFISYDPCSFLTIMAAMCGCLSVVHPIQGLTKQQWIQTTAASEYAKSKGIDNLYGIAYGNEQSEYQYAFNTMHLVKEQWNDILKFNIEKTIIPFINDIQKFEGLQNTIQNNYF